MTVYNYSYKKIEDQNISYKEFSSLKEEDIEKENIFVTELFEGIDVKIYVNKEGNKKFIYNVELKNKGYLDEYYQIFQTYFSKKLNILFSMFNKVEFVIYGKCINYDESRIKYFNKEKTIIFSDIYINSNWIHQDDVYKFLTACQILNPEILYEGVYSNFIIKDFVENYKSVASVDNVSYGFCIKNEFEESFGKNSSRHIYFIKSEIMDLLLKQEEEEIDKFIDSFIQENFIKSLDKFNRIPEFKIKYKKEKLVYHKNKIINECSDYVFGLLIFSLGFINTKYDNTKASNKLKIKVEEYLKNNILKENENEKVGENNA